MSKLELDSKSKFFIHQLENGLTLVAEPMSGVESAAFSLIVPTGAVHDEVGQEGISNITAEMLVKGSGSYSSKEFSEACEAIGLQKGVSSGMEASSISGQLLGENLAEGLNLGKQLLLEPRFPGDELDSVKSLALQDIASIEDEPSSKVMEILSNNYYPHPFSRNSVGTVEGIAGISIDNVADFHKRRFVPEKAVLSVAGKFNYPQLLENVKTLFSSWEGSSQKIPVKSNFQEEKTIFHSKETAQLQIALAYPSVGVEDPYYYSARVWVNILSGGMSGRLFIEVREKRGLVYRVSASHSSLRDRSSIIASAGTTVENGEECLSVMLDQLRCTVPINDEELNRAKVDLKTRVVMQTESSMSRASSIGHDMWSIGRVRAVEEIKAGIEAVSISSIKEYLERYPVKRQTLVVLGEKELKIV